MMRRGSGGIPFLTFSQDLESRGISIDAQDASDNTRLNISCTTDQLEYAVSRANLVLAKPDFPEVEFSKFKQQWIAGLLQTLNDPASVAGRDLGASLYPNSTQGRRTTPQSLESITLEDVRKWYETFFQLEGALVIVNGDVSPEQSAALVKKLTAGFDRRKKPAPADYTLQPISANRRIILVDNPEGRQATIRMGVRAYEISSNDKFAGTLAGNILSAGIESRLNKYVRAEKGLAYGCRGYFTPGRHQGEFTGQVDTNPATAGAAIEAMMKVFNDMKAENVTPVELSEVKSRTTGGMVMETQTIAQQAGRRLDQILNGYPIDYWDQLPQKLSEVTADQIRSVMNTYVKDDGLVIVVIAPADAVKAQLEKLGTVEVVPMPLKRDPAG
jgi:predicted Zn-dependent peptidase